MTKPRPRRAAVTATSVRSEESFLAILGGPPSARPLPRGQPAHLLLELPPAVGVVREHVEGGARGGEENGVSGAGGAKGPLHRLAQAGAARDGHGPAQGGDDALPSLADGQDAPPPLLVPRGELGEVAPPLAA